MHPWFQDFCRARSKTIRIASGQSSREIPDARFISRNPVSTHVCNLLTKTRCANRTAVSAYAVRQGLSET
jgi:DNA-binding CsgD family transcriptional regulator